MKLTNRLDEIRSYNRPLAEELDALINTIASHGEESGDAARVAYFARLWRLRAATS